MADARLTALATELEQFGATAKAKPIVTPQKPEPQVENYAGVARSILGYAFQRAPEDASSAELGEAIAVGIRCAADELSLPQGRIYDALKTCLESMVTTVRDDLSR